MRLQLLLIVTGSLFTQAAPLKVGIDTLGRLGAVDPGAAALILPPGVQKSNGRTAAERFRAGTVKPSDFSPHRPGAIGEPKTGPTEGTFEGPKLEVPPTVEQAGEGGLKFDPEPLVW